MLIRDTKHYGITEIHADTEIFYESLEGTSTIIPYSETWERILVQVSGGLDSALMLYLISKTLNELGSKTKIIPTSFEVPTKAKNLGSARAVIKKIKELLGAQNFLDSVEVHIPIEHCTLENKDRFFRETLVKLKKEKNLSFEFNGNTKNPPEDVRKYFRDNDDRQFYRDNRTTIYNSARSASPHAFVTKKGIVQLYRKHGILEELSPLTLSCDMDIQEIEERNLPIPCGECWWCRERRWGFESNNEVDLAKPIKT